MNFFILGVLLAAVAMFVPHTAMPVRVALSMALVVMYVAYIVLTVKASKQLVEDGHGTEAEHAMLFNRLGLKDTTTTVVLQLAAGLGLLVLGAKGFINGNRGVFSDAGYFATGAFAADYSNRH